MRNVNSEPQPILKPKPRPRSQGPNPPVTKPHRFQADKHGMEGRNIEPRTTLWAVAEVSWQDPTGTPNRATATLEDTSPSGACIRLKTPISIGSRLMVRWKKEQFFAIAKNCRSDGHDFLLGVCRDTDPAHIPPTPPSPQLTAHPAAANNRFIETSPVAARFLHVLSRPNRRQGSKRHAFSIGSRTFHPAALP